MISACSGAVFAALRRRNALDDPLEQLVDAEAVFALIRSASCAAMPMMSSIWTITLSGSAVGRSILLITGTTSSPCSIAV